MGWWSKTVMGGDGPLDYQGDMYDACGVTDDDRYDGLMSPEEIDAKVQANIPSMMTVASRNHDEVGYQVLGVMVMRHGCDPSKRIVQKALKMAMENAYEDEWAHDSTERCEHMVNFFIQLSSYDGTPQEPVSESLFDKIFGAVLDREGLVNL